MKKGSEFEELVAQIHRYLAPLGVVAKNERIRGRSGALCECDVTVRQSVGPYPSLVVIECKDTKKKVGIAQVRVFADKLLDVRARGVLVATAGFTRDALKRAHDGGILTLKYREAMAADWECILGPKGWIPWIVVDAESVEAAVKLKGERDLMPIPMHFEFVDSVSGQSFIARSLFTKTCEACQPFECLGEMDITCDLSSTAVFLTDGGLQVGVEKLVFRAKVAARRYHLNAHMTAATVLDNEDSGDLFARQLVLGGIDWKAQMDAQEGVELTEEQYQDLRRQTDEGLAPTLQLSDLDRYLRIVLTHQRGAQRPPSVGPSH